MSHPPQVSELDLVHATLDVRERELSELRTELAALRAACQHLAEEMRDHVKERAPQTPWINDRKVLGWADQVTRLSDGRARTP